MRKTLLVFALALLGCIGFIGCGQKDATETVAPGAQPGAPADPNASKGKGVKPTSAPSVEVNSDYNGPAAGSKAK